MFGEKQKIIQTQEKHMERYREELEALRKENNTLRASVRILQRERQWEREQNEKWFKNSEKSEAAFRSATDEIERLRDEIQRRRRLYQAGTNKLRGNLGEMGRAFGQLRYQHTVLQKNLDVMTDTAAGYEREYMEATAENRELRARLLCYQGIEKLLFGSKEEPEPAAAPDDSGKLPERLTAGQVVVHEGARVRIVDVNPGKGTALVYDEGSERFDTVPVEELQLPTRPFTAVELAEDCRIIQYADGYLIVVLQKTDDGEWKVLHAYHEVYMLTENGLRRLGEEFIRDHREQEPTTLFTVGNVVKYCGETFTIEKMTVGENNQTDAVITNDHATLCVPVEELEAVRE